MANSKRKCSHCKSYFRPDREFPGPVAWCGTECGTALAFNRLPAQRKKEQAAERREHKKAKERVKTRSEWVSHAQRVFNQYIRERDKAAGYGCVSCGRMQCGHTFDCGHFRSIGSCPELRFEEMNAHMQGSACNRGQAKFRANEAVVSKQYEERLRERIGDDLVDWLQGPHEPKRYTIDDLKEIIKTYRAKLKELKANRNHEAA